MNDPDPQTSLQFWIEALSSRGGMANKIKAVSSIKNIPDAQAHDAFDRALRDVFADTPPYDISKIPSETRIMDVLKDFADESDQDYSTPYIHFISSFLQDVGLVNVSKSGRPIVADMKADAPIRNTDEGDHKTQGGAIGSSSPQRHEEGATTNTSSPSVTAVTMPAEEVETVDLEPPATGLEAEVGSEPLSYTFDGTSTAPSRIGSGELMRLPKILPPPPAGEDGDTYAKWLDGEIWHPQAISLRLTLFESDLVDDIFEMQSEFYAVPSAARETYGSRTPFDLEASSANNDGYRLYRRGRDIGFQEWTFEAAKKALAESVYRYFCEYEPVTAEYLERIGFEVKIDIQLAAAVSAALDVEKYYMEKDPPDNASEGGPQNLRGSISSGCRLDRQVILDSAVIKHFFTGTPIATSLVEGLRELRQAQLSRHLGVEISNDEFDRKYDFDCFFDLDEYFPERSAVGEMSPG